jgi:hypothetical protein
MLDSIEHIIIGDPDNLEKYRNKIVELLRLSKIPEKDLENNIDNLEYLPGGFSKFEGLKQISEYAIRTKPLRDKIKSICKEVL